MLACIAIASLATFTLSDLPCAASAFEAEARELAQVDELDLETLVDLVELADDAERIATALDGARGAGNLACVFRGLANETRRRSAAYADARNARAQRRALRELRVVLADAVTLAAAAGQMDFPDAPESQAVASAAP